MSRLDECVSRFLAWKLPKDFYPDCFISFDREKAFTHPYNGPTGTNLLHAGQAKAMLEEVCAPLIAEIEELKYELQEANSTSERRLVKINEGQACVSDWIAQHTELNKATAIQIACLQNENEQVWREFEDAKAEIEHLKAQLEAKSEPVAWYLPENKRHQTNSRLYIQLGVSKPPIHEGWKPLYASPQAINEQLLVLLKEAADDYAEHCEGGESDEWLQAARAAIEAAEGVKK